MLWGKKQTKSIIHPSTSLGFLLFYFPKPRGQVWILIYRKWPIRRYPFILLSFSPKNTTQWPGQVSNPDLQTLTPASFSHWAKEVFKNSSSLFLSFLAFQYECGSLTVNTLKSGRKVFFSENWAGHTLCLVWRLVTSVSILYTASLHTRV